MPNDQNVMTMTHDEFVKWAAGKLSTAIEHDRFVNCLGIICELAARRGFLNAQPDTKMERAHVKA